MKKFLLLLLFANSALASEYGYSVLDHRPRDGISESARGVEGRINFGGGKNDSHYSGDRWSLGIGALNPRLGGGEDGAVRVPKYGKDGGPIYGHAPVLPSYYYLNFTHRWYTPKDKFSRFPRLRLYVGTGISYREAETCAIIYQPDPEEFCWDGTVAVSSKFAFHQSFGIKWRERVELAWEHDSTARISNLNLGDDVLRFTLFVLIGTKNERQ